MPTPESAAFRAKKPAVPPTFDGVDYDDPAALKAAQDAIIREQWVKCMMARVVRDELALCYRREGLNHLANCSALRGELSLRIVVVGVFPALLTRDLRWRQSDTWSCSSTPRSGATSSSRCTGRLLRRRLPNAN